jgi:hypothetical protein
MQLEGMKGKTVTNSSRSHAMSQNRESGARANEYGRITARRIAQRIGAKSSSKTSNEFELDGRKVTIRCARFATNDFGVTYKMLKRIDAILGALEQENDAYEIYELSPKIFQKFMRATRSKGPSAGKVGIVNKSVFVNNGTHFGSVNV